MALQQSINQPRKHLFLPLAKSRANNSSLSRRKQRTKLMVKKFLRNINKNSKRFYKKGLWANKTNGKQQRIRIQKQ